MQIQDFTEHCLEMELQPPFAGFISGSANTTYGENTGVLELSKVYDPTGDPNRSRERNYYQLYSESICDHRYNAVRNYRRSQLYAVWYDLCDRCTKCSGK